MLREGEVPGHRAALDYQHWETKARRRRADEGGKREAVLSIGVAVLPTRAPEGRTVMPLALETSSGTFITGLPVACLTPCPVLTEMVQTLDGSKSFPECCPLLQLPLNGWKQKPPPCPQRAVVVLLSLPHFRSCTTSPEAWGSEPATGWRGGW